MQEEGGEPARRGDKVGVPLGRQQPYPDAFPFVSQHIRRYYPVLLEVAFATLVTGGSEQQGSLSIPGDNSPK